MICLSENDASTPQSWPSQCDRTLLKPLLIKHDNWNSTKKREVYSWENHLSGIFHCHLWWREANLLGNDRHLAVQLADAGFVSDTDLRNAVKGVIWWLKAHCLWGLLIGFAHRKLFRDIYNLIWIPTNSTWWILGMSKKIGTQWMPCFFCSTSLSQKTWWQIPWDSTGQIQARLERLSIWVALPIKTSQKVRWNTNAERRWGGVVSCGSVGV